MSRYAFRARLVGSGALNPKLPNSFYGTRSSKRSYSFARRSDELRNLLRGYEQPDAVPSLFLLRRSPHSSNRRASFGDRMDSPETGSFVAPWQYDSGGGAPRADRVGVTCRNFRTPRANESNGGCQRLSVSSRAFLKRAVQTEYFAACANRKIRSCPHAQLWSAGASAAKPIHPKRPSGLPPNKNRSGGKGRWHI